MAGKGNPRTGGRAKGTLNQKTQELRDRVERLNGGKSLIETLVDWATEEYMLTGDREKASSIMAKAVPYVYSTIKAVELSGSLTHEMPLCPEPGEEPVDRIRASERLPVPN